MNKNPHQVGEFYFSPSRWRTTLFMELTSRKIINKSSLIFILIKSNQSIILHYEKKPIL